MRGAETTAAAAKAEAAMEWGTTAEAAVAETVGAPVGAPVASLEAQRAEAGRARGLGGTEAMMEAWAASAVEGVSEGCMGGAGRRHGR